MKAILLAILPKMGRTLFKALFNRFSLLFFLRKYVERSDTKLDDEGLDVTLALIDGDVEGAFRQMTELYEAYEREILDKKTNSNK